VSAAETLQDRPTTLYRFHDAAGELLYVGITAQGRGRWYQHQGDKDWWSHVAKATVEHFPNREAAAAAEVEAIRAEKPLHNIKHNGSAPRAADPIRTTGTMTDRLENAYKNGKAADTLVGSYFLSGYERGWHGCVVAEPQPGIYLVETFSWIVPDSVCQILVPLREMVSEKWQFFDTPEWMDNQYNSVEGRWARERAEAGAAA
jgi:predicted GIY-YIG superfamily endonuclease